MKLVLFPAMLVGLLLGRSFPAAEASPPTPKAPTPEEWSKMTPEQQQAQLKEAREARQKAAQERAEKARAMSEEEWQKLTPEQRRARLQERQASQPKAPARPEKVVEGLTPTEWQKLTPDERQAKLKELQANQRKALRERIEKMVADLKKKKTDGKLNEAENRQLDLWEQRLKTWDQPATNAPVRPAAAAPKRVEQK
jgi:hypothetical protein